MHESTGIGSLPFRKDNVELTDRNCLIVNANRFTQHERQLSRSGRCTGECAARKRDLVRRRITPEVGRGLEKLGHALEYLKDEFVHDGCRFAEDRGRLQAIQLLATLNREIYFACEIEPSLRENLEARFRRLFRLG